MEKQTCCGKSSSAESALKSPCCSDAEASTVESSCHSSSSEKTSSCCEGSEKKGKPKVTSSCCGAEEESGGGCCDTKKGRPDYMLWGSLICVVLGYAFYLAGRQWYPGLLETTLGHLSHGIFELINTMAWGVLFGVFMVALLAKVPRELVMSLLGTGGGVKGLLRATGAGLLLDLCSHGILMVGAKLYERGASTGQVMAFLIASPWNSFSLTLILIAMIGLGWTAVFILLSAMIAIVTGLVFDKLVTRGVLPANPNTTELPENFNFWETAVKALKQGNYNRYGVLQFILDGIRESRMVIRWLLFGVMLAALIRTFVPTDYFGTYFGPTLMGLGVTLVVATILEVCSEGSTPIAADIFNRAFAPGNSFAFLMTGVSTDYTEIMVLKDVTRSWKVALFLPLITLPQVVVLAFILNSV